MVLLAISFCFHIFLFLSSSICLDNGLVRTPPMGWNSWNFFECNTDCHHTPNHCLNEKLFKEMADAMVTSGMKKVGYQYINIDDCWTAPGRASDGTLVADPQRFPNGMKALADYIHSKGLKFGIYADWGKKTCAGYTGSLGFEEVDAKTFASWGVDYVKLDGCYGDTNTYKEGYTTFGRALNESGRQIVYSCSWPFYDRLMRRKFDYQYIGRICNLWRIYDDIVDDFFSTLDILGFWAAHSDELVPAAGPGRWNDLDMLEIGNGRQTHGEYRVQFSVWAILASPLIAGNDLRKMDNATIEILTNEEVIAINQDPEGKQGRRVHKSFVPNWEIWLRHLTGDNNFAIAIVNSQESELKTTVDLASIGISGKYAARDLWARKNFGILEGNISITVPPHDVLMLKLVNRDSDPVAIQQRAIVNQKPVDVKEDIHESPKVSSDGKEKSHLKTTDKLQDDRLSDLKPKVLRMKEREENRKEKEREKPNPSSSPDTHKKGDVPDDPNDIGKGLFSSPYQFYVFYILYFIGVVVMMYFCLRVSPRKNANLLYSKKLGGMRK